MYVCAYICVHTNINLENHHRIVLFVILFCVDILLCAEYDAYDECTFDAKKESEGVLNALKSCDDMFPFEL